jgi:hypothetical protein
MTSPETNRFGEKGCSCFSDHGTCKIEMGLARFNCVYSGLFFSFQCYPDDSICIEPTKGIEFLVRDCSMCAGSESTRLVLLAMTQVEAIRFTAFSKFPDFKNAILKQKEAAMIC